MISSKNFIITILTALEKFILHFFGNFSSNAIREFIRFSLVGATNFLLDAGILNILSFITHRYTGPSIILFNTISFSTAVASSYFLNKNWTFRHQIKPHAKEVLIFFLVNIVGLTVNTSVVYGITTFIPRVAGITPQGWLILAKIAAVPFGMVFNFLGAKKLVFHKQNPAS